MAITIFFKPYPHLEALLLQVFIDNSDQVLLSRWRKTPFFLPCGRYQRLSPVQCYLLMQFFPLSRQLAASIYGKIYPIYMLASNVVNGL